MNDVILVSGTYDSNKIQYYERLNESLHSFGYELLLLKTEYHDTQAINTSLNILELPSHILKYYLENRGNIFPLEKITKQFIYACMLTKADHRSSSSISGIYGTLLVRYSYFKKMLDNYNIKLCILFHQFNGTHTIFSHVCRLKNIPYLFTEFGAFPGTASFDAWGQMAESWVSQYPSRFKSLPIDKFDIEHTESFLEFLKIDNKTREQQSSSTEQKEKLEKIRALGRPVIFMAGQNDYATGMLPNAIPRSRMHSPFYKSTLAATKHLARVAEKNNWHIIFKPHPGMSNFGFYDSLKNHDHIDVLNNSSIFDCIHASDLTVTILSQVSYYSLIYDKPVLLLGKMQLNKKGCVYELEKKMDLENSIQKALKYGFTNQMRVNWKVHFAQMIKHYLFSMDEEVEKIIGRNTNDCAIFLNDYINDKFKLNGENKINSIHDDIRLPFLPNIEPVYKFKIWNFILKFMDVFPFDLVKKPLSILWNYKEKK
jgi:hypothetical protein